MALQDALRFIQEVGRDTGLQTRVRQARLRDFEDVVRIAVDAGFELTADELREAFSKDWAMRRRFYSAVAEAPEPDSG